MHAIRISTRHRQDIVDITPQIKKFLDGQKIPTRTSRAR